MLKTILRFFPVLVFVLSVSLVSCKSVISIPDDLDFNPKRHSHIHTMQLHMLYINRVNGKKLENTSRRKVYDVMTYPGWKTVDVIYVGGTNPYAQHYSKKRSPGTYHYWAYEKQKRRIRFKALPGRAHYIQYIAHQKGPMSVWVDSYDYISHMRDKPVYKKDLSDNRTMKVSRIVKGSLSYVKKRFLNELIVQVYLKELIGSWSIQLMFQTKGNTITVNRPGIGEREIDNWVTGRFKFFRAGRGRTRITMHVYRNVHTHFPNFMKQVFARFDPRYRKNVLK